MFAPRRHATALAIAAFAAVLSIQGCHCGRHPGGNNDGGADAGCAGAADNTKCVTGSSNGFCKNQVCTACAGPQDDSTCQAAYGNPALCVGGTCVAGANCRSDNNPDAGPNCLSGQICGLSSANICAPCTTDTQCQNDPTYGNGTLCSTGAGQCVSASCSPAGSTCNDGGYFCCASGPTSNTCMAGNCCSKSDCLSTQNCIAHVCTGCPAPTGNTYYVDPVNGSDNGNTGSTTCPFATISHALTVIGGPLSTDVFVDVLPGTLQADGGEQFPLSIPTHIHIVGILADGGVPPSGAYPMIRPPLAKAAFTLAAPTASLSYLDIEGPADGGSGFVFAPGINVPVGSAIDTAIDHVLVQQMYGPGIAVSGNSLPDGGGGVLSIGPGVTVAQNGTISNARSGLDVSGGGYAAIASPSTGSSDPISFNANTQYGIQVTGNGYISISGTPGTIGSGNGTVVANSNANDGVLIAQAAATAPQCSLNGLVAWANGTAGTAAGLAVVPPSNVKLRNSILVGNVGQGAFVGHLAAGSDDVSHVDFGTDTSTNAGHNVFQVGTGGSVNTGVGICLWLNSNAAQTLQAQGNVFSGPTDCANSGNTGHTLSNDTFNFCTGTKDESKHGVGGGPNTNVITATVCVAP